MMSKHELETLVELSEGDTLTVEYDSAYGGRQSFTADVVDVEMAVSSGKIFRIYLNSGEGDGANRRVEIMPESNWAEVQAYNSAHWNRNDVAERWDRITAVGHGKETEIEVISRSEPDAETDGGVCSLAWTCDDCGHREPPSDTAAFPPGDTVDVEREVDGVTQTLKKFVCPECHSPEWSGKPVMTDGGRRVDPIPTCENCGDSHPRDEYGVEIRDGVEHLSCPSCGREFGHRELKLETDGGVPCPREVWRAALSDRRITLDVHAGPRATTDSGFRVSGHVIGREKVGDGHTCHVTVRMVPDGELAPVEIEAEKVRGEWSDFRVFQWKQPRRPSGPKDHCYQYVGTASAVDISGVREPADAVRERREVSA